MGVETKDSEDEDEDEENGTNNNGGQEWKKNNNGGLGTKIPLFEVPELSEEQLENLESCETAYDFYKLFSPVTWIQDVVYNSRLYGAQRDFGQRVIDKVSVNTLRCTEAFFLQSGYGGPPQRKMSWESRPDVYNHFIAQNVRRDDVDAVLKCLHFRDNTQMDQDGYYKVRPIFDVLNKSGAYFRTEKCYAVDECMIPYFGKHGSKQFIYGKPVRFGYKVK